MLKGVVAQWCNPPTLSQNSQTEVGSIAGRAQSLECHHNGLRGFD